MFGYIWWGGRLARKNSWRNVPLSAFGCNLTLSLDYGKKRPAYWPNQFQVQAKMYTLKTSTQHIYTSSDWTVEVCFSGTPSACTVDSVSVPPLLALQVHEDWTEREQDPASWCRMNFLGCKGLQLGVVGILFHFFRVCFFCSCFFTWCDWSIQISIPARNAKRHFNKKEKKVVAPKDEVEKNWWLSSTSL